MFHTFVNWLTQILSITGFSLKTIPARMGASLTAIIGVAGVVAVFIGVLSIAQGFKKTMTVSASPDSVMILRLGADSEMMSILMNSDVQTIQDYDEIARDNTGPRTSAELFVIIDLPKKTTGTDANVPLRGIQEGAYQTRLGFKILDGRRFEPGKNEVIVGKGARQEFKGLDIGSQIKVGKNSWTVVGIFSAAGGLAESEIWTDSAVLQSAYQRGTTYQSISLQLKSPDLFESFQKRITSDPQLKVKVMRQSEFYADQAVMITRLITILGRLVAFLMATGAVLGALNTMFNSVSQRTREIATLRALGFGRSPVVISVLIESMCLAVIGGIIGAGLAYAYFNGYRAATINWQSFSQVVFSFEVTTGLLIQGVVYACLIGLLGGLFPAVRASRLPIAQALREL